MNFNKSILDKINNFVKLSKEFDKNYNRILNQHNTTNTNTNTNTNANQLIFTLTNLYIKIREEHGKMLMMVDELKNLIVKDEEYNNVNTSKLYDLSTFSSIIANVSELLNNIDFQYKKIATDFPTLINKKQLTILLLSDDNSNPNSTNSKYIELIKKLENELPENKYKIINCSKSDKKINCAEELELGFDHTIKITKLPMLFVYDQSNLTEIPTDKINDINFLENLIRNFNA